LHHFEADPDPSFQVNADPGPIPHQSDAETDPHIRICTKCHGSTTRFRNSEQYSRKDNSSQSSGGRLRVISCCHVGYEGPNSYADRLRNMDLIRDIMCVDLMQGLGRGCLLCGHVAASQGSQLVPHEQVRNPLHMVPLPTKTLLTSLGHRVLQQSTSTHAANTQSSRPLVTLSRPFKHFHGQNFQGFCNLTASLSSLTSWRVNKHHHGLYKHSRTL
jgi:hypothetical protein